MKFQNENPKKSDGILGYARVGERGELSGRYPGGTKGTDSDKKEGGSKHFRVKREF